MEIKSGPTNLGEQCLSDRYNNMITPLILCDIKRHLLVWDSEFLVHVHHLQTALHQTYNRFVQQVAKGRHNKGLHWVHQTDTNTTAEI